MNKNIIEISETVQADQFQNYQDLTVNHSETQNCEPVCRISIMQLARWLHIDEFESEKIEETEVLNDTNSEVLSESSKESVFAGGDNSGSQMFDTTTKEKAAADADCFKTEGCKKEIKLFAGKNDINEEIAEETGVITSLSDHSLPNQIEESRVLKKETVITGIAEVPVCTEKTRLFLNSEAFTDFVCGLKKPTDLYLPGPAEFMKTCLYPRGKKAENFLQDLIKAYQDINSILLYRKIGNVIYVENTLSNQIESSGKSNLENSSSESSDSFQISGYSQSASLDLIRQLYFGIFPSAVKLNVSIEQAVLPRVISKINISTSQVFTENPGDQKAEIKLTEKDNITSDFSDLPSFISLSERVDSALTTNKSGELFEESIRQTVVSQDSQSDTSVFKKNPYPKTKQPELKKHRRNMDPDKSLATEEKSDMFLMNSISKIVKAVSDFEKLTIQEIFHPESNDQNGERPVSMLHTAANSEKESR